MDSTILREFVRFSNDRFGPLESNNDPLVSTFGSQQRSQASRGTSRCGVWTLVRSRGILAEFFVGVAMGFPGWKMWNMWKIHGKMICKWWKQIGLLVYRRKICPQRHNSFFGLAPTLPESFKWTGQLAYHRRAVQHGSYRQPVLQGLKVWNNLSISTPRFEWWGRSISLFCLFGMPFRNQTWQRKVPEMFTFDHICSWSSHSKLFF